MNKNIGITLIVILGILVIGITSGLVYLLKTDYKFNFNFDFGFGYSDTLVDSKEIDTIKDIYIDADTSDIKFKINDEDKISVELYSEDVKEFEITDKEDKVNVKLYSNRTFGFSRKSDLIIVKIPSTYDKYINIIEKTGDIDFESFENMVANINVTTGDVRTSDLKEATIKTTTGDVKVDNVESLKVTVTTGDIKVNRVNNLESKSTTGDVVIGELNNKVNIESKTGDVKIDVAEIKENSSIKASTGDVKIHSLTGAYVEAKTNIGDNKVNNNDRKSDIVLEIKTSTGDIKVN